MLVTPVLPKKQVPAMSWLLPQMPLLFVQPESSGQTPPSKSVSFVHSLFTWQQSLQSPLKHPQWQTWVELTQRHHMLQIWGVLPLHCLLPSWHP